MWNNVQRFFEDATTIRLQGLLLTVNVEASFLRHKIELLEAGYKFNYFEADRSFFDRLDRHFFFRTSKGYWASDILEELVALLKWVNILSKPDPQSLLSTIEPKYVKPISELILLITHEKANARDMDLLWEFTDRISCFGHPLLEAQGRLFDETCYKITQRLTLLNRTMCRKENLRHMR